MENSWEKSLLVIFVLLSRGLRNFFLLMTNSVDRDSDNDKSTVHDYLALNAYVVYSRLGILGCGDKVFNC